MISLDMERRKRQRERAHLFPNVVDKARALVKVELCTPVSKSSKHLMRYADTHQVVRRF